MAGDWVKMRSNLDTHPKVVAIACDLETSELHVVGMLWKVWTWADQHSLDGNAICVTESFLNRITGNANFSTALRKVGWLDGNDGELTFPRFSEHNGKTAKSRSETALRVNKHRSEVKQKCNAPTVTNALPEKRREEKKEEKEFSFSTDEKRTEGDRLTFPVGPSPESTRFFDAYPKKTKRNLVPDAFVRAVDAIAASRGWSEGPAAEWLIAKAQMFAKSPMGSQKDKEKIPNPAAWLDEGRYDDGPGEWELAKPPDKYHQKPKIKPLSEEQKELNSWNFP